MGKQSLYVETVIRTDMDTLWRHTQDPSLHQRWDLRFGEITALPGARGRFRYATRILGVTIAGTGVSAGERERPDGTRTSALRFASADPLSLIRSGSGYWRYTPTPDGIRFATGFDYTTRWGGAGSAADRLFRPLFGWATAWSFDRLRLWLEAGVEPDAVHLRGHDAPRAGRCSRTPSHRRDSIPPRILAGLERA
jgi:hypothetical protein